MKLTQQTLQTQLTKLTQLTQQTLLTLQTQQTQVKEDITSSVDILTSNSPSPSQPGPQYEDDGDLHRCRSFTAS